MPGIRPTIAIISTMMAVFWQRNINSRLNVTLRTIYSPLFVSSDSSEASFFLLTSPHHIIRKDFRKQNLRSLNRVSELLCLFFFFFLVSLPVDRRTRQIVYSRLIKVHRLVLLFSLLLDLKRDPFVLFVNNRINHNAIL